MKAKTNIFIINGVAGSGKDRFVKTLINTHGWQSEDFKRIYNMSLVDPIKEVINHLSYSQVDKTDKTRKLISDLLINLEEYNECITSNLVHRVLDNIDKDRNAYNNVDSIIFIHIRQAKYIDRVKKKLTTLIPDVVIRTILLERKSITHVPDNDGDKDVYNYTYDIILNNTEDRIENLVRNFKEDYL